MHGGRIRVAYSTIEAAGHPPVVTPLLQMQVEDLAHQVCSRSAKG